ncbi:MAG: hypothetical protein M1829_006362 [Trizodia sp. TS-e1964]|nr:MAG: hypothetical protein M1829_006362 [Trizodia sp. TS-e1964]
MEANASLRMRSRQVRECLAGNPRHGLDYIQLNGGEAVYLTSPQFIKLLDLLESMSMLGWGVESETQPPSRFSWSSSSIASTSQSVGSNEHQNTISHESRVIPPQGLEIQIEAPTPRRLPQAFFSLMAGPGL